MIAMSRSAPLLCVNNIIPDMEVPDFQNIGVQEVLKHKKMLLAFDTGTGKTYTYALIVRGLLNRNPDKKHIFVIIHDSLIQAPNDLAKLISAPVASFSSVDGELNRLMGLWKRTSVIVLTYECFRSLDTVLFLYQRLPEIESVTIDEAHHVSNWDVSDTAFMLRSICVRVPYICALTATPITRYKTQYYQLMNLIDRNLSFHRDETFQSKYDDRYLPVNRKDYDLKGSYKTTLELVTPATYQLGRIKGIISKTVKGSGATPQVNTLVKIVAQRLAQGKKVIVYVHYHDTRHWVEENFKKAGINSVSLHGKIVKQSDRDIILSQYKTGVVDVLITSVAESLNIDSDVVVFYEFTTKIKQVMGRAHRGLSEKELELVFIITKDTDEVEYFMEYIYERSITIQKLLRKDYSEFISVGEQLKKLALSDK